MQDEAGCDILNGELGRDIFDYNAVSDRPAGMGRDFITDFQGLRGTIGDLIDLSDIDANIRADLNQSFVYIGSAQFREDESGSFTPREFRYADGILSGNINGDREAELQIELVDAPELTVGGAGTDILL